VVDRRRDEVPSLRERGSRKALETSDVGLVEESRAFIDLVSPRTVILNSGVQMISITETSVSVPRFDTLPTAGWRGEPQPFPLSDAGLSRIESTPPACGLVSVLSTELWEDLTPELLSGLQVQILRSVGLALDRGLIAGSGTAPEPRGIANTTGLTAVSGTLANLRTFSDTIGALVAVNAAPSVIVITPATYRTLLGLMEAAGSNKPLVPAAPATQGFTIPNYFRGVTWYVSAGVPANTALVFDPSAISVVLRHPADLAVDPYLIW
jgi:HK97 family phage major capsid protein